MLWSKFQLQCEIMKPYFFWQGLIIMLMTVQGLENCLKPSLRKERKMRYGISKWVIRNIILTIISQLFNFSIKHTN